MKKLIWAVVALLIVLIIALGAVVFYLDPIAKRVVEDSATTTLGVNTTLDNVTIKLLGGNIGLQGLNVPNVQGYQTPHLMNVKNIDIDVQTGSVMSDTLLVDKLEIKGTHLNIEQKGLTTNVSALLQEMNKRKAQQPPAESSGKKMKVGRIVLKDTTAVVQVLPIGGKATTLDVKIDELVLQDVTPENATEVATPELIRRVIPAILAAVVEKGAGVIPEDLRGVLKGDVNQLVNQLGGEAQKMINDQLGNISKQLPAGLGDVFTGKKSDGATTPAGDTTDNVKKAAEGLKNIFKK